MQRMIWLSLLTSLTLTACAQAQEPQPAGGDLVQIHCAETAITDGSNDPNTAPSDPESTAAVIKKDEREMQTRREAVRYLGTVDWGRWPEAEKALVEALLYDRSECVRFEAALALQKGSCCTKLAVKALTDCVTGVSNPAENSERVKLAAKQALSHNIRTADPVALKDKEKEKDKKPALTQADYYQHVQVTPQADIMTQARKALAEGNSVSTPSPAPRLGNVAQIVTNALTGSRTVAHFAPASAPGSHAGPNDPVTAAAERKPFFDGLTKTLKGPPIASQPATPAPIAAAAPPAPPVTVTVSTPAPALPQTVVVTEEAERYAPGQLPATLPIEPGALPSRQVTTPPWSVPALPGIPPSPPQP